MFQSQQWQRSGTLICIACTGFVVLWDFLFWEQPLGISAAVFAAALCAGLILRTPTVLRSWHGRAIAGITLLAAAALAEEPTRLGIAITVFAIGTLVLIARRDVSPRHDAVSTWLMRWPRWRCSVWARFLRDTFLVLRRLLRHPRISARATRIIVAAGWWVLPLLAGALFLGLFAFANPAIARFVGNLQQWIHDCFDWLLKLSLWRIIVWELVGVAVYGLLRHRHMTRQRVHVPPVVRHDDGMDWMTGPQMVVRLLVVLNAVFAVENALDAAYLYFGVPLPDGMNYTSYAHRGAYTLIVTALLAGAFTLGAFREGGTAQRSRACRWLVYAWIAQNILLLISTVWRVGVYVDTTQLTRLRTSTMIWCGLVAMGFVWIILRIKHAKPNRWLWRMNTFSAATVLLACCFVNFDGLIADFNVRHCAEAGGRGYSLDVAYLRHLGPPALPAVQWAGRHDPGMSPIAPELKDAEAALREELAGDLRNWRSWTFRRHRAASSAELRPEAAVSHNRNGAAPVEPLVRISR